MHDLDFMTRVVRPARYGLKMVSEQRVNRHIFISGICRFSLPQRYLELDCDIVSCYTLII